MNWRALLSKIQPVAPPLDAMVRESATRAGEVDRRAFLQICGTAVAGMALDPERLLYVPSAKTILLPDAPTLAEHVLELYTYEVVQKGDVLTWGLQSLAEHAKFPTQRPGQRGPVYYGVAASASAEGKVRVLSTERDGSLGSGRWRR